MNNKAIINRAIFVSAITFFITELLRTVFLFFFVSGIDIKNTDILSHITGNAVLIFNIFSAIEFISISILFLSIKIIKPVWCGGVDIDSGLIVCFVFRILGMLLINGISNMFNSSDLDGKWMTAIFLLIVSAILIFIELAMSAFAFLYSFNQFTICRYNWLKSVSDKKGANKANIVLSIQNIAFKAYIYAIIFLVILFFGFSLFSLDIKFIKIFERICILSYVTSIVCAALSMIEIRKKQMRFLV